LAAGSEELAAEMSEGVVRVDDGVVEGGEISVFYDPMIAKLITFGPSRESARLLMLQALDRYSIRGLRHNVNFLRSLLDHPRFAAGRVTTAFIPEEYPDGYEGHMMTTKQQQDLVACAAVLQSAWARRQGGVSGAQTVAVSIGGDADHHACVSVVGGEPNTTPSATQIVSGSRVLVEADGWSRSYSLLSSGLGPDQLLEARCQNTGDALAVQVLERTTLGWTLSAWGTTFDVSARPPKFAELSAHMKPPPRSALDDALLSPMPGTLIELKVVEGDTVHFGQQLCVVEAMKMQNVLTASRDGVVKTLMAQPGSTLAADQPIMAFEAEAAAAAA